MSKNGGMSKDRGKRRHVTSFYLETLVLAVVLIAVILVLTRMFAFSADLSDRAGRLTRAVHLAENAAEAVAASDGMDTLRMLLEEDGNAQVSQDGTGEILQIWYDEEMRPASGGRFRVEVSWKPEAAAAGSLVGSTVSVYWMEEAEPLYVLDTAVYTHAQNHLPDETYDQ